MIPDFFGMALKKSGGHLCPPQTADKACKWRSCTSWYADLESKRPIRPGTLYRLYSNTKIATVTAMMQLYEGGAFLLHDPVSDDLPEYRDMQVGYFTGNNLYTLRRRGVPTWGVFTQKYLSAPTAPGAFYCLPISMTGSETTIRAAS